MTQDEIIKFSKQAGIRFRTNVFHSGYCDGVHGDELEAFAKLVDAKATAREREACAEMCKKHADVYGAFEPTPSFQAAWAACIDLRDQIRARGEA